MSSLSALFTAAYRYLRPRARTRKEMEIYLTKRSQQTGWTEKEIEQTIELLEEEGSINDAKFIPWFVESRSHHKAKSTYVLKQELARMGISQEDIDTYFDSTPLDEEELAYQTLLKRSKRYHNMDTPTRTQKMTAHLRQRGFSFPIIRVAIARWEKEV